ncbi:tetratricopeptide repeat protein [Lentzea flava]|uniref:Preprotein translocase SecA n=1 Tax=Lentzea flava TaxID=103732 RepID=A0ABQ2UHS4_9PSEU|nr:tetratricopeptide repeat protein [Lentzea flava]MCP2199319.1 SEC-C motif-containing protein [Lentzea flava]GGU36089.1 preprotein translocase SecA [Lentzea flava]
MDAADKARLLDEDLEEDREGFLLDAARAWHEAGDHDRAIELLTEAVELGVEDHDHPRVLLAEVLFDLGRDDEARAQLRALRKTWPDYPEPYEQAGELMRRRGEFEEALNWYDLAVAQEEPRGLADRPLAMSRREVRQKLGLPEDDLDKAAEPAARRFEELVRQMRATLAAERSQKGIEATIVAFWPRAEVPRAHEKWPELVPRTDVDAMMRDNELYHRELSESGERFVMVPLMVDRLTELASRTGGDPMDEETLCAYVTESINDDLATAWPPGPNAPCWCGSGSTYGKCCGRLQ